MVQTLIFKLCEYISWKFIYQRSLSKARMECFDQRQCNQIRKYRALCITKGSAVTDEDKQAQAEANRGVAMHPALIQARLLSDGNYAILAEKNL